MTRGLSLSMALHAVGFALVFVGPAPRLRDWNLEDRIAVELVAPPLEMPELKAEKPEPPKEELPPPVPEPVKAPEPEPEKPIVEEKPPEAPKPVTQTPKKNQRAPLEYMRWAPKREEPTPSLEERLRDRLAEAEPKKAAAPSPETQEPAPEPAPASPEATAEVEAADFPYAWYLNTLRTKITDSWDPPADRMVAGGGTRVVVRFRVHADGRVSDIQVEGASRTPGLDASARRAVDRARPFPPLPDAYAEDVLEVAVRFTLTGSAR